MERSKEKMLYVTNERTGDLVRIPAASAEQYQRGQKAVAEGHYKASEQDKLRMLSLLRGLR